MASTRSYAYREFCWAALLSSPLRVTQITTVTALMFIIHWRVPFPFFVEKFIVFIHGGRTKKKQKKQARLAF